MAVMAYAQLIMFMAGILALGCIHPAVFGTTRSTHTVGNAVLVVSAAAPLVLMLLYTTLHALLMRMEHQHSADATAAFNVRLEDLQLRIDANRLRLARQLLDANVTVGPELVHLLQNHSSTAAKLRSGSTDLVDDEDTDDATDDELVSTNEQDAKEPQQQDVITARAQAIAAFKEVRSEMRLREQCTAIACAERLRRCREDTLCGVNIVQCSERCGVKPQRELLKCMKSCMEFNVVYMHLNGCIERKCGDRKRVLAEIARAEAMRDGGFKRISPRCRRGRCGQRRARMARPPVQPTSSIAGITREEEDMMTGMLETVTSASEMRDLLKASTSSGLGIREGTSKNDILRIGAALINNARAAPEQKQMMNEVLQQFVEERRDLFPS